MVHQGSLHSRTGSSFIAEFSHGSLWFNKVSLVLLVPDQVTEQEVFYPDCIFSFNNLEFLLGLDIMQESLTVIV